ncbi:MAG: hypothetical protein ABJK37_07635 [Paraglaciecola sp.]|uniref:carboxymuconolactone decarboxylase family protein n=1 Tax=Paraglaciecola sp. TaxID=1920173 RepID=UPI003299C39E
MPRISPFNLDDLPESARSIIGGLPPIHVFETMGHLGETFTIWVQLIIALNRKNQITERHLEMTILHAANQEKGTYEWGQHKPLSVKIGITKEQRDGIRNHDYTLPLWSNEDQALLNYLQQVVEKTKADDACWKTLREYFSEAQVLELSLLHGTYRTLSAINVNAETPMDEPAAEQSYQILEGS